MTVLKRDNEPKGTYTEGYDAGLQDATEKRPQQYKAPTGRQRNASMYRFGYADGYQDGRARRDSGLDVEALAVALEAVDQEDDQLGVVGRGRKVDRIAARYSREHEVMR